MNQSDAERMAAVLEKAGLTSSSEKEADILIVNVCAVRQRAIDRVYALVSKWQKRKDIKIILTGCVLEKDKKLFQDKVYAIVPIGAIANLPRIIKGGDATNFPVSTKSYLRIKPNHQNSFSAYVPIMTGCNNFCAYCVVPYTRGREASRPADEIIREVEDLVKNGYKEIILLGQNVNSYKCKIPAFALRASAGKQKSPKQNKFATGQAKIKMTDQNVKIINFPKLLQKINNIPGNFWIRFLTSHPKDMSEELIEAIASSEKMCKYIHLPIQSGDNEILEKMNRQYTVEYYLNLIKKIRSRMSEVAISTDIIVGFPGETKKQFENTVKVFKKVKFDMAYIAQYSPRPDTAAAKFKDDIPNQEKKRRFKILNQLLKKIALKNNQKLVGKEMELLVEQCGKGYCMGKMRGFKNVRIHQLPPPRISAPRPGGELLRVENITGQFVKVKITKAEAWGLQGQFLRCLGSGS